MKDKNGIYSSPLIINPTSKYKNVRKVFSQHFENVGSAFLYGISSISMTFANKAVLTSYNFNFPFFIMACQMTFGIICLEVLRKVKAVNLIKYSMSLGFSFIWPSVFHALHSVTSLYALSGMSIPMYTAVKRCTPLVTLGLSVIILKKSLPSLKVISAVFLITFGCILASIGDLEFDMKAYIYGGISVLVQSLYLTLSQKYLEDVSSLQVLYINSCNTILFYFCISLYIESSEILHFGKYLDAGFLVCFTFLTAAGVLLNYSLFLCTAKNSALTTSLVGVLKSIIQTIIGFFTFGGVKFHVLNILGICINITGGIMYTHAKYLEKLQKELSHFVQSV